MNAEERRIAREITAGLDRRHFLRATGAAALAALAGGEARLVAGTTKPDGSRRHHDSALDGRRHGANGNVRPEALYTL